MNRARWLVAALAAVPLLLPSPAQAGTYKVQMCRLSDGSPAPVTGWHSLSGNSCAAGGTFGVSWPSGAGVNASLVATLSVPSDVAITRADAWREFSAPASWQGAQPTVNGTWETRGWTGSTYTGDQAINAYNPASPNNALIANNPSSMYLRLDCWYNGPATPNNCTGNIHYSVFKLDLHMTDGVAPQVTQAPSGPLLAGGWLAGPSASMTIGASDVGSGAYRAFIRIGSTTRYARLAPNDDGCADGEPDAGTAYEFAELVPCTTAGTTYAPAFDLAAIGDGTHTNVTIGIEDAAGNERVALTNQTLRINAPGGTLPDPATPCTNGTYDDAGVCQVAPPTRTTDPLLTGTAQEGGSLSTDDGTWTAIAGATWSYGWQRCDAGGGSCADIAGALARAYGVTSADVGKRLRSKVSVTTNGGTATAYSTPSPVVAEATSSGGGAPSGGGGGGGGRTGDDPVASPATTPPPPAAPPATGGQPRANGTDATPGATIALRANGSDRREVSIVYGRDVVVEGRLATPRGKPIGGATIDVFSTPRSGASTSRREAPVVSAADGTFRVVLPPGASRVMRFAYRAFLDDAEYSETAELDLRVRTKARLKATPKRLRNGSAVTFRGRVDGAPRGSRKVVEMQVQQEGEWLTFATTRIKRGRFTHKYRFTRTTRRTPYVFRAVVRTEAGWPYETGASNATRVVVRR